MNQLQQLAIAEDFDSLINNDSDNTIILSLLAMISPVVIDKINPFLVKAIIESDAAKTNRYVIEVIYYFMKYAKVVTVNKKNIKTIASINFINDGGYNWIIPAIYEILLHSSYLTRRERSRVADRLKKYYPEVRRK